MAATRHTVLTVDDDAEVRALLRDTLERAGFGVCEAADAEAAVAAVDEATPHLVLLEVVLPGITGYEVYELLRQRLGEQLPIIFLSGTRTDRYDRIAGLLLGADDYVVKPFDRDELVARIRRCLRSRQPVALQAVPDGQAAELAELTPREREVLTLLADGSTTADIAHDLLISPRTVGTHVEHIFRKLRVRNRRQAAVTAYRAGLVPTGVEAPVRALAAAR